MLLEELEAASSADASIYSDVYDTAPDLKAIASLYTLLIRDGTRKYDGVTYNYRYIIVTDNKGYCGLTLYEEVDALTKISAGQTAADVMKYSLNYGFSSLMSSTPVGMVVDWTLGAIFTVLSDKPTGIISVKEGPIYKISHRSVTSMTYYFIYNDGWKMIGVGASAEILRDDYWSANINGIPKSDFHSVSFSTRTPGTWNDYLDVYFNNMASNSSFCLVNRIGSFSVTGDQNFYNQGSAFSTTFTPKYARYPADLL